MKKLFYLMVVIAVLGLIVSGCSIPLKSVVPTSEKGNLNPELGTPTLEKITFIHYIKPNDRSKLEWDDTADIYKFMYGGIKWAKTMQYEVNTAGSAGGGSGLILDGVMDALSASLETWDAAIEKTSPFELFNNDLLTTEKEFFSGEEFNDEQIKVRINRITFDNLSVIYGARVIAVCVFWINPATKEIVESDVRFNTEFTWSADVGETCAPGEMDLQSIATHEFGHNGLNDLYMPKSVALTMYGYGVSGDIEKRSLGTGDELGIQELYGE